MGTPANDQAHGEQWCEQLTRRANPIEHQGGIELDIGIEVTIGVSRRQRLQLAVLDRFGKGDPVR